MTELERVEEVRRVAEAAYEASFKDDPRSLTARWGRILWHLEQLELAYSEQQVR